jgi:hypothetical protein
MISDIRVDNNAGVQTIRARQGSRLTNSPPKPYRCDEFSTALKPGRRGDRMVFIETAGVNPCYGATTDALAALFL